jgi:hypothetical protein
VKALWWKISNNGGRRRKVENMQLQAVHYSNIKIITFYGRFNIAEKLFISFSIIIIYISHCRNMAILYEFLGRRGFMPIG